MKQIFFGGQQKKLDRRAWEEARFHQANRVMSLLVRYERAQGYIRSRLKAVDTTKEELLAAQYALNQGAALFHNGVIDEQNYQQRAKDLEAARKKFQADVARAASANRRAKKQWEEAWEICRKHNLHFASIHTEAKTAAAKGPKRVRLSTEEYKRLRQERFKQRVAQVAADRAAGKLPPVEPPKKTRRKKDAE